MEQNKTTTPLHKRGQENRRIDSFMEADYFIFLFGRWYSMSTELINRITVKKDGVYVSSHSSNDTSPYHSWRCKGIVRGLRCRGAERA